jgi:hypothetical protein
MRANHGVRVVSLFLIVFALPSCSPSFGEIAVRMGRANRLHVLWYPCSPNWKADEVRLYRLEGRFQQDGKDHLIASSRDTASNDAGEGALVWDAQLPLRERLGSGGRYAVEVAGPNFGVHLDFRAPQLASDRWFTWSGPMAKSSYIRLAADGCDDSDVSLLVAFGVIAVIVVTLVPGKISAERSRRRAASMSVDQIPPRPDVRAR